MKSRSLGGFYGNHTARLSIFLTWCLYFAPAQCYYHWFRDNSGAKLRRIDFSYLFAELIVHYSLYKITLAPEFPPCSMLLSSH